MKDKFFLLLSILPLSGCLPEKPFYINESKPVVDMQRDYSRCREEAEEKYPIDMASYKTAPRVEPIETECTSYSGTNSYTTRCSSSGGYIPPETRWFDMNGDSRFSYEQQCLRKKGYKLKNIPWCSSDVPVGGACYSGFDVDWRSVPILTISNGKIQGGNECLSTGTCSALFE